MGDVAVFDLPCVLFSEVIIWVDYGHLICHFSLVQHDFTLYPIKPGVNALTLHLIVDPLSFTPIAVGPPHSPWPMQLIALKVANAFVPAIGVVS